MMIEKSFLLTHIPYSSVYFRRNTAITRVDLHIHKYYEICYISHLPVLKIIPASTKAKRRLHLFPSTFTIFFLHFLVSDLHDARRLHGERMPALPFMHLHWSRQSHLKQHSSLPPSGPRRLRLATNPSKSCAIWFPDRTWRQPRVSDGSVRF